MTRPSNAATDTSETLDAHALARLNARQRRKRAGDPMHGFLASLRARGVKVHRFDRSAPETPMLRAWWVWKQQQIQGRRLVQAALTQGHRHRQKYQVRK